MEVGSRESSAREACRDFFGAVREAFDFLTTDFGFSEVETGYRTPECWILFRNRTTEVAVTAEPDGEPWVAIEHISWDDGILQRLGATSLELLMEELQKNKKEDEAAAQAMSARVKRKARHLKEFGAGLLRGDFSLLPKLEERARLNLRRRNLELFGSENGETPRS